MCVNSHVLSTPVVARARRPCPLRARRKPIRTRRKPAAYEPQARRMPAASRPSARRNGRPQVPSFSNSLLICRERQVSLREWLGNKAQDRYSILVVHLSIVICEDYMYAVS